MLEIALGVLDGESPVAPDAHIFVGSRANWVSFGDRLPRYAQGRSSALLED